MSRIDFEDLALSADQARAARNYFAWPQATAAEKSGLPLHKFKRFETGNYVPDDAFLRDLRAFYERNGYTFDDTVKPGSKARREGLVFPAGVVGEQADDIEQPMHRRAVKASIHHMRIALGDESEMGHLLDMIEENEEKARKLLEQPIDFALFGGLSEATKKRHAQALRLMSENGVMFAKLFGREIGGQPKSEILEQQKKPATGADLLHGAHREVHLACKGCAEAKERHKTKDKSLAETLDEAFGLT